eukprot:scaffold237485_cov24-Tisochrysis_lutea.AAC.4
MACRTRASRLAGRQWARSFGIGAPLSPPSARTATTRRACSAPWRRLRIVRKRIPTRTKWGSGKGLRAGARAGVSNAGEGGWTARIPAAGHESIARSNHMATAAASRTGAAGGAGPSETMASICAVSAAARVANTGAAASSARNRRQRRPANATAPAATCASSFGSSKKASVSPPTQATATLPTASTRPSRTGNGADTRVPRHATHEGIGSVKPALGTTKGVPSAR